MQIDNTRFGRIEVADRDVIRFPQGLYGLEQAHSYCLVPHDERGRFLWLQSVDVPAIAMVVTDPFLFFRSYEVEIPDSAVELLQAASDSELTLYTSITISPDHQHVYTNLLGPIVIHHGASLGMQVVQDASRYCTRHLIGSGVPASLRAGIQGEEVEDKEQGPAEESFRLLTLNARTRERQNA